MQNKILIILFCFLTLLSCSNRQSNKYYVKGYNIYCYGISTPIKKLNFQTKSFIEKPDSLILNEFYSFDSTIFKESYLYLGAENKLDYYFNKKPFESFFKTNIKSIKIQLFDSDEESEVININPNRKKLKSYTDSLEDSYCKEKSTDYLFINSNSGYFFFKDTMSNKGKFSCNQVATLFSNVIKHASNNISVSDLDLKESDYLRIDTILKDRKVSFKKHQYNSKEIVDSVRKYPYCLKSCSFMNYMRIEFVNEKNDTLTVNDCSQILPTGVKWIFKLKSNYLKCYDFRICDFIKQNISPKHRFYQYLNRSWTILLQYQSMNSDMNINCVYIPE